jgi:hypothetical protein
MNRMPDPSADPLFDPRLADWLEGDPYRAPDTTLEVVLAAFPSIKQRRAWRVPWRFPHMSNALKLGGASAAIVIAVLGGSWLINAQPGNVGGPRPSPASTSRPSPTPTPSPTPSLLDTSTWVEYASDRYGFNISRPADWTEDRATRNWTFENDLDTTANLESTEHFNNPEGSVGVSAWSVPVTPGTTLESWLEAYCAAQNGQDCTGIADRAVPVQAGDGHSGLGLYGPETDTMAFFISGDRIYVAAVWRGETDPNVAPYGGAWRLLRSFVSTMTFEARPASPSPSS